MDNIFHRKTVMIWSAAKTAAHQPKWMHEINVLLLFPVLLCVYAVFFRLKKKVQEIKK